MIKAIIFDCFGVVLTDSLQEMRAKLVREDPVAAREVKDIVAANNRGWIQPQESNAKIAAMLGMSVEAFRTQVRAGEVRNQELLDYVFELRGNYKTGMLSNVATGSLERRFPDNELSKYFDEVVISAEIGFIKPDPEAYKIAAERLCVLPSECVFTDDKPDFCDAAGRTGMRSIVYKDFVQFRGDLARLLDDPED
ncbi:HAD-IA family hydrolase [Candidatus Saccharibacteria bacterium]|nr:MAG: HAD-IA family hydrolase [Candidatus Saccharibacteria bacterium]